MVCPLQIMQTSICSIIKIDISHEHPIHEFQLHLSLEIEIVIVNYFFHTKRHQGELVASQPTRGKFKISKPSVRFMNTKRLAQKWLITKYYTRLEKPLNIHRFFYVNL